MSDEPYFDEWVMSKDFPSSGYATEIFDAEHGDRIGYFRPPFYPPVGTRLMFHGEYYGDVIQVSVDLRQPTATIYVTVKLEDPVGFWRYREAMRPIAPERPSAP